MRCLLRNKQKIFYANFIEKKPLLDEEGMDTGEWQTMYEQPTDALVNISKASGERVEMPFGKDLKYDRVLCFGTDEDIHISDACILWVDNSPDDAHDYEVKGVYRSLNSVLVAAGKVKVNG